MGTVDIDAVETLETELTELHTQAEQARLKTAEAREQAAAAEAAYKDALRQAPDEEISSGAELPEGLALKGAKAIWQAWQERLAAFLEAIAGKGERLAEARAEAERRELDALAATVPALIDRVEQAFADLALALGEAHDALRRLDEGWHPPNGQRVPHPGAGTLRRFFADLHVDRANTLRALGDRLGVDFDVARRPSLTVEPARLKEE